MDEHQITCKVHDKDEVITHVGITGEKYSVSQVVEWINNRKYSFYTIDNGIRAEVKTRQHHQTGKWFLISTPDGTTENNLDYLPDC